MIQSNNLNVRNLSKKIEGYNGIVDTNKIIPINNTPFNLLEINLEVVTESRAGYISVVSAGGAYSDVLKPQLYNDKMKPIYNFQFRNKGSYKLYADLKGFENVRVHFNPSNDIDFAEVKSNFIAYNKSIDDIYIAVKEKTEAKEDVLFEGKNFIFEKKAEMKDAWNGIFIDYDTHNVWYSDELDNPKKNHLDMNALVNSVSSPVLEAYIIPYDPEMKNTTKSFRIAVGLANRDIYVNYFNGGDENTWGKSKWWESRDTVRKIPTKNISEVDALHRYDVTLPDDRYSRNSTLTTNGATFIEFQEQARLRFLGGLCRTKKMVTFGTYLTDGTRICNFITTDGGENWVLAFDFMSTYTGLSSDINTSAFSPYTGGLILKKVNLQSPSEDIKEVENPFTYVDIEFQSIDLGVSTKINASNHGLKNGDIVLFSGTPQDNNYSSIICHDFTANGFSQIVYSVANVTANSFEIKEYLGSYDMPLFARHIHSNNECINGVIVSSGEEYPNSWNILIQQKQKDASAVINAFNFGKSALFRLNSSELGLQRACGFLMDNEKEPNVFFNADTSNGDLGSYIIDGRTNLPTRSSNGLWYGKLKNIDNWKDFECILPIAEPGIWLFQYGNVIVGYYQLGTNVVSIDRGKSWEVFPKGTNLINGVFNNNIVIGNGYVFKYK